MAKSKAASLQTIQNEMNGDLTTKLSNQYEYVPERPVVANETPKTIGTEYVIFKLVNNKKRGRVHVDNVCDAINPDTGKMERMRILVGVESIWLKDQKDITKEYADMHKRTFVFEDRVLRVESWDTQALDYLRRSKFCLDNKDKKTGSKYEFFEWNPKKVAEQQQQMLLLEIEAMKKAMEMPLEKMKKHALFLGVLPVDELGMPKTDDMFRNDYIIKAKLNPKRFLNTIETQEVEIWYMVKRAIMDAKIDVGREKNKAYFSTGKFICSIPPSRTPTDVLIELALSPTQEGREFVKDLEFAIRG